MIRLLALTIALSTAACAGSWGGPQRGSSLRRSALTAGYVASASLVACDAGQTIWIAHGGRYDRLSRGDGSGYTLGEMNPLLGTRPEPMLLAGIAVVNAVGGYAILRSDSIPDWLKGVWFGAEVAIEAYTVANNSRWSGACGAAGTNFYGYSPEAM